MKKFALLLFCLLVLSMIGCETEPPDYVGVWVDSDTLAADFTKVTFDLKSDEGTITIEPPSPAPATVITGTLEKSGSTLTATITAISVGGAPQDVDIYLGLLLLTRENTFTYSVSGNTLTITGALIAALTATATGGPYSTLVGTRS
jgi:hypothetical protein